MNAKAIERFLKLQAELDGEVSSMVQDLQQQIGKLQSTLENLVMMYPKNEAVMEYTNARPVMAKPSRNTDVVLRRNHTGTLGRPRFIPRIRLEYVDGQIVEMMPNPARKVLAQLIKENPTGSLQFDLTDNVVNITCSGQKFRFSNPISENTSGLKSVGIC